MDKKNQILMSVLGVFALVIVTVGVSYAFFTYSRTGTTTNTIQSGDVSFTYQEGESATLTNAFPVADAVGATDTTGAYTFNVSTTYSDNASMYYNIFLVKDMNKTVKADATTEELEAGTHVKGYFADSQIKLNLLDEAGTAVVGTTTTGVLASSLTWDGNEAQVLTNAAIATGTNKTYTLRLWIDSAVDYSNTALTDDGTDAENDAQTSVGKYNGYEYSLKVKVTANAVNTYTGAAE